MPTPLRDPGEPEAKLSLWFQGVFRPQRVLVQEQKSIQKEMNCHRSVYSINSTVCVVCVCTHTTHTHPRVEGGETKKSKHPKSK